MFQTTTQIKKPSAIRVAPAAPAVNKNDLHEVVEFLQPLHPKDLRWDGWYSMAPWHLKNVPEAAARKWTWNLQNSWLGMGKTW